jgi:hypothetical protein
LSTLSTRVENPLPTSVAYVGVAVKLSSPAESYSVASSTPPPPTNDCVSKLVAVNVTPDPAMVDVATRIVADSLPAVPVKTNESAPPRPSTLNCVAAPAAKLYDTPLTVSV